jgi:hypothetical protein
MCTEDEGLLSSSPANPVPAISLWTLVGSAFASSTTSDSDDMDRGSAGADGGGGEARFIWIFGSVDCILA